MRAHENVAEATPAAGRVRHRDVHSYAQPEKFLVRHVDLDLEVSFDRRQIKGTVTLAFDRLDGGDLLVLDSRDLAVHSVEASEDGAGFSPVPYNIEPRDPILGSPLSIRVASQAPLRARELCHRPGRHRIAMAGAGADRLGAVSLPVYAIARDPRAKLDSIAGYTRRPRHFFGAHPNARGAGGGHGSGYEPGLPAASGRTHSNALAAVEQKAAQWIQGVVPADALARTNWSTHEVLHFLDTLPVDVGPERMQELDRQFGFTRSENSEVLRRWLLLAVRNRYAPADAALRTFLLTVGRRKHIKPIYEELVRSPEGRLRAQAIYSEARPRYHPITQAAIDAIVGAGAAG